MEGGLLRGAFEVASRLTTEDYEPVPIVRLTCGQLREDDLVPILDQVRAEAAELRRAMLGDTGGRPTRTRASSSTDRRVARRVR